MKATLQPVNCDEKTFNKPAFKNSQGNCNEKIASLNRDENRFKNIPT